MDYSRLRAAALKDGEDEEAVTVDTRALIDKVLARYSGEWTTLRELIQNAADAQATSVKIKWETLPSTSVPLPSTTNRSELLKHVLTNHTLRRLVVQNNGQPFTKTDWGRLKRIAEGNPDETKIGAFGVGFYSVFADCEEPFVSSGSEAMAFYWKGNALFTRKLQLPDGQGNSETAFVLDYRNTTTPLPNLLSVGQFLATSLTFVALQNIEFWIDDWKVLSLQKKTSPNLDIPIPRDLETWTKDRIMKLAAVERTSAQIDASFMSVLGWKPQVTSSATKTIENYGVGEMPSLRNFFSRLTSNSSQVAARGKAAREEKAAQEAIAEDLTALSTSSIFLRVTSASVQTHVNASFAAELERATKKPPPKVTKLSILTSSYDETLASEKSSTTGAAARASDIFASVLPSKKPGGRIFIGFPTTQTTGAGMHISAPSVIPTVEREAIDLNARWVRSWNIEMLRVAGIMTRLAFANEMTDLQTKLLRAAESRGKGSKISSEDVAKFVPEALHILKTYTFEDSTPSAHVAQIIEEAFWTSFKKPSIEVYSSCGVLLTTKVRTGSDELSKFVDGIPVIIKDMKDTPFIRKLTDFGLIKDINVDDVRQELEAKALTKEQLIHFITWAGKSAASGELDPPSRAGLLGVAIATISDGGDSGGIIALGSIKNYLSTNKIPPDLPIPPTTLPYAFTHQTPVAHLQALGWETLEIVPWLRFLIETGPNKPDEQNIMKSTKFSIQVLTVLSKNWDNLSQSSKSSVVSALQNVTAMPTKMGMRKPAESFFPSVKLFDDLPILQGTHGIKDKFLTALGVRKTVDLETIFTRLLSPSPEAGENGSKKWSHVELIKYLASVRDDIPADDMKKLKSSQICPAEAGPTGMESTKATTQLYKVSELFEPKDTLRTLGLPILQWPGPPGSFRPSSPEARFLTVLGLRPYPTVPELVDMMSSSDAFLREKSRTYFIANHHINGYANFNIANTNKAILPLQGNEKQLVPPSSCYTNEDAAVLGFDILKKDLHLHANKFGVVRDPPITECVNRLLARPPQNRQMAITLFEYFTSRLGDLGENSLSKLRDAPIVPILRTKREKSEGTTSFTHVRPQNCYLGSSSTYGEIFDFVDFGANANAFLFKCGAKNEPTKLEIARLACTEPVRLSTTLQSSEKYLNLLRSLAEDLPALKKDKDLYKKMKTQPWLLASREISSSKGGAGDDEDETPIMQYQLAAPNKIVILDDYISYRLFKDSLICAPQEEILENFYLALGSQTLGSMVQEDLRIGPHSDKQQGAAWLRKHVIERSRIFLYEYAKYRKDVIKHDAKWLEKHLTVEVVKSVALRRSLRGHPQSHTEKRSAASAQANSAWVLYVAAEQGRPDMYQVGQAVCQILLTRPSQQAYFFFEPLLKLDLLDLRARGYNVDRILRAKREEARIEEEQRRKALEAEQQRIREAEQEWTRQNKAAEAARETVKTPDPVMPGSFGADSPEDRHALPPVQPSHSTRRPKGLFSNLSKRFGFDKDEESEQHLQNFLHEPESKPVQSGPSQPNGTDQKSKRPQDDGRVTSPAVVQQNLLNAIKSTRPHDSSTLFSPPKTEQVKEQSTYCDSKPAHNINFAAEAPNGMRVFVAKDLSVEPVKFLSSNITPIGNFENLLRDIGNIYGLPTKAMHMFYDEKGGTIAFNSNGSIFCNLRFFIQLHASKLEGAGQGEAKVEAAVWWWVVIAHELAHNLQSQHNSEHSYYT
ncbi:putative neutral zinc metallopeptidase protein [Phaeoacremonium minimum UCRPA7]|uniref:Putative neutral zinc metallopeptidase protein n=1 Tax=Phaeoacremonium minimum (strain UCR-PA7) TaxID=1286976 RepID=R8BBJ4_PHAM7|nr:putative neutral zinc metallopeptidase protein [Phaeoacremonium minimum UCRPA7]EON96657.1 putative neutral zinc metallopeptidase protein [Phaeoacremonium minimum UCRPA7]